ncbi:hypothetical protein [uncultured Metabacillus sp.]|uniref:hypothetical protein n=1 Tax=uncultured Metabacillus sp. TaxID=2860135 RepID=UPI00261C9742|nr:hypothetical protein [uncultured Metabacillus sp.]
MKNAKWYIVGLMVLPWLSSPLIGRRSFRKYWASSLFMSCFVAAESYLARKRKWWWVFEKIFPVGIGELPLIIGPFFIGTIWILKLTHRSFTLYLLVNAMVHYFFSYFVLDFFKNLGIGALVRLKRYQLMLIFLGKSIILYGVQKGIDKVSHSMKKAGDAS